MTAGEFAKIVEQEISDSDVGFQQGGGPLSIYNRTQLLVRLEDCQIRSKSEETVIA